MDTTTVTGTEVAAGAPPGGESAKGLNSGALGLFASVVIGIASVAPAYSLAATVGILAAITGIGLHGPFIFIVGFIPMVLVASGFYYMNQADPDCGETFIWTSRAFGAPLGWIIGFAAVASSVIVMSNLVYIAAQYMFYMVGMNSAGRLDPLDDGRRRGLDQSSSPCSWRSASRSRPGHNTCSWRCRSIPMILFTVWALIKGYATHPAGFAPVRLSWFFTTHISSHALAAGVVLAVFLYWGWDTVLAVNEESEDSSHMPGVSAVLNTIILVLMYVLITAAMQCYHGAGFLAKNPDDVFSPLARDVMGGTWDRLVFLCLLTSGAASALTTLLPLTRQTLSMAAHKSLPAIFGRIHPKYLTPFWGTIILSVLSILWFVLVTLWNANAIWDAISAIGIMVCIAYGGTGLAATVYYRKELLKSAKNFFLIGVAPTLGAILFALILVKVLYDDYNPVNSYTSFHGIGGIFLMGVGTMLVGVVLLIIMWIAKPEFFKRGPETWPGEGQPIPYADERVSE